MTSSAALSDPLFEDDFDAGVSAAAWTARLSGSDASVDYAFDYSSLGIPTAPNSAGGTTLGMRFLVNQSENLAQGVSASPVGLGVNSDFRLRFDGWLNYVGPLGGGLPENNQIATFGIGSDGVDAEWPGTLGSGVAIFGCTTTGEGSDNFQAFVDGIDALPVAFNAGSRDHAAAYYQGIFPSRQAPAGQTAAYGTQAGITQAGETAFAWHEFELMKVGDSVTWSIDGNPIATLDLPAGALAGDGIFLGFADMEPTSSFDPADFLNAFIVDNVRVEPIVDDRQAVDSFALDLRTSDKIDTNNKQNRGLFGGAVMAGDSNDVGFGNNVPVTVVSISGFDLTGSTGDLRLEADLTEWSSDNTMVDPQGFRFRFTIHVEAESTKPGAAGLLNGTYFGRLAVDETVQLAPNEYPTIEEGEALVFSVRDLEVLEAPPGHDLRFASMSDTHLWVPRASPVITYPTPDTLRFEWSDADPEDEIIGTTGPNGFLFHFDIVEEPSDAAVGVEADQLVIESTPGVELDGFALYNPGGIGTVPLAFEITTDTPEFFAVAPAVDAAGSITFQPVGPGTGNLKIRARDDAGFTPWAEVSLRAEPVDLQGVLPLDPFRFESHGTVQFQAPDMAEINTDTGTIFNPMIASTLMTSRDLLVDSSGRIWRVFCVDDFGFAAGSIVSVQGFKGYGCALISRGDGTLDTDIIRSGFDGMAGADAYGGADAGDGGDGTDGGAMALVANGSLSISGSLLADGGAGGDGGFAIAEAPDYAHGIAGDGGNGGAGGYILVSAPHLTLSGILSARGGHGGDAGLVIGDLAPFGAEGLGGDGGIVVIASNIVKSADVHVDRGNPGSGIGTPPAAQNGLALYPSGVSYLGPVADFRRSYGLAGDGSEDGADWSGNGIPNLFYHAFALGDPHEGLVDRSRLPSVHWVGDAVEFSYVVPDDPGNLRISPLHSTDLESFVHILALPPEDREIGSVTSVVEGIYVRRTLTFPMSLPVRFFSIEVADASLEGP